MILPLFCAPQTSQSMLALRPTLGSSRLPQSLQKINEPMAVIVAVRVMPVIEF